MCARLRSHAWKSSCWNIWCLAKFSIATIHWPADGRMRRNPTVMEMDIKSFFVNWKNPTTMFGYSMDSKYSTSCVSMSMWWPLELMVIWVIENRPTPSVTYRKRTSEWNPGRQYLHSEKVGQIFKSKELHKSQKCAIYFSIKGPFSIHIIKYKYCFADKVTPIFAECSLSNATSLFAVKKCTQAKFIRTQRQKLSASQTFLHTSFSLTHIPLSLSLPAAVATMTHSPWSSQTLQMHTPKWNPL